MSAAAAGAAAEAGGAEVPASAPQLRDVADAPAGEALRTYDTQLGADELLKQFLSEISDVARDAEVVRCAILAAHAKQRAASPHALEPCRVVSCFKLNPYEHLNLRFDSTIDEVKRQYRKARCTVCCVRRRLLTAQPQRAQISLMVHPDKCKHPRSREAFEGAPALRGTGRLRRAPCVASCRAPRSRALTRALAVLGKAQNMLLDEEFRANIGAHLARSRDLVLRDWWKTAKDDVVLRVRHGGNKEAMEAAFVPTEEFQERWKVKTREIMVEFEWRKRRMGVRIQEEEARVTAGEKEAVAEQRAKLKEHREWDKEDRREKRVGGWRDFMTTQKSKKSKGELAGYKGPKLRPEEKKEAEKYGGPKDEKRVARPDEVSKAW
jgi:DnaJ family protein C protein 8